MRFTSEDDLLTAVVSELDKLPDGLIINLCDGFEARSKVYDGIHGGCLGHQNVIDLMYIVSIIIPEVKSKNSFNLFDRKANMIMRKNLKDR